MRLHQDELDLARAYSEATPFEGLSREQMHLVMDRGRTLHHWFKQHLVLHSLINFSLLLFLLSVDYLILLRLPFLFVTRDSLTSVVLAALVTGGLHSFLMYSIGVWSIHEGAAHRALFPGQDLASRALEFIASNLCRLGAMDPRYYAEHHMSHHAKFGTAEDGEFLNYVRPRRYWLTLLPYGSTLNYSDFIAHRPPQFTVSFVISLLVAALYHAIYGYFIYRSFGLRFTLIALLLFVPHVGFYLDRLRQYSEHNLMPLDNKDGARSFGLGFWGMLIGGGPWGTPCHWEHHLVPSVPWYQQLLLHRYLVGILTRRQREQYLLQPVIGYPRLLWRLWREPKRFEQQISAGPFKRSTHAS